jgi:hypothetical protein
MDLLQRKRVWIVSYSNGYIGGHPFMHTYMKYDLALKRYQDACRVWTNVKLYELEIKSIRELKI